MLSSVGLPHSPDSARRGGRVRGSLLLPSMAATSAVDSPDTNAPAPAAISMLKENPLSRIGIVSNWEDWRQTALSSALYYMLGESGAMTVFFLVRLDPARGLPLDCVDVPNVTCADFKTNEGVKEFCRPWEWADEHDLDAVIYTEARQERWLEFMRERGTPEVRVFTPEGNVYEAVDELVEELRR